MRSCSQGLDVRTSSPSNAEGEVFFLDIPFYRTRPGAFLGCHVGGDWRDVKAFNVIRNRNTILMNGGLPTLLSQ